jgi:hypothetical protein
MIVVESMKMEMQVTAPADGTVIAALRRGQGRLHRSDPRDLPPGAMMVQPLDIGGSRNWLAWDRA